MQAMNTISRWRRRGALLALALLPALAWSPAHAQFATGGSGLHKGRIYWISWGLADGANVPNGTVVERAFNVGMPASPANEMKITCQLTDLSGTVQVYTPGNWQGDGLDDLYNIGGHQNGSGPNPNTMRIGLATVDKGNPSFNFSCSATLGGAPFALSGLVFADAEASGGSEYVAATPPAGAVMRAIDQIAKCRTAANPTRTNVTINGGEYRLNGPSGYASCENNGTSANRAGPILVAFIDGATSARVSAQGGGKSAIALGAVIELEFSEAIPASYGTAVHVLNGAWEGGLLVAGGDYNRPEALATPKLGPHLGTLMIPDADANSAVGGEDVDALPKKTVGGVAGYAEIPRPRTVEGTPYTIPGVRCVGPSPVAAWIDFDGNGKFDDDERSGVVQCPAGAGTVDLTWTLPMDYKAQATSYMRIRMARLESDLAHATGVAGEGEVEDYRVQLPSLRPSLTIRKITQGGTGSFGFDVTNGVDPVTITTTVPGVAVSSIGAVLDQAFQPTVVTEAVHPGFSLSDISCTGMSEGGQAIVDLPNRRVTLDAASAGVDAQIVCTFTNTTLGTLRITKVAQPRGPQAFAFTTSGDGLESFSLDDNDDPALPDTREFTGLMPGSYSVTEMALPNWELQGLACQDPDNGTTVDLASRTASIDLDEGETVSCTFTNAATAVDLVVSKDNGTATLQAGGQTTYTVVAGNPRGPADADGARVVDEPGEGLSACAVVSCTASGGAQCPLEGDWPAMLDPSGVAIPHLPVGGEAVFKVQCDVD